MNSSVSAFFELREVGFTVTLNIVTIFADFRQLKTTQFVWYPTWTVTQTQIAISWNRLKKAVG